tara:strand:- start:13421 stop:14233 length:813 start_codon:yes stop_codon:yes gene_type:complete
LKKESNFIELSNTKRIWAIGSIHSNYESFKSIKKHILLNFKSKDKLVILGNVIGLGNKAKETLTSIIDLRFKLMANHNLDPKDVIFLRGAQEEMFLKLMQLQIAPNPQEIVEWMFEHGVDKTIESYGFSKDEAKNISSQGTLSISKWTIRINSVVTSFPGHQEYFYNLKHAAFTNTKKILFVNRGVDVSRPLSAQNDCFWWGYQNFSKINQPYGTYIRIVRGYESQHSNSIENIKNSVVCTLFKQPLSYNKILCGLFNHDGEIIDVFESQ